MNKVIIFFVLICDLSALSFWGLVKTPKVGITNIERKISSYIDENDEFPHFVEVSNEGFSVKTTIDQELQDYISSLLSRYKSDLTLVSVIDNETGKVLAVQSYDGKQKRHDLHYALKSLHPAASLFKVIAAADLLEHQAISPDKNYLFRGKSTTLYKYQLKPNPKRWVRKTSLKKAFALSNNPVIAKAVLTDSTEDSVEHMAKKFGFYEQPTQFLDLPLSQTIEVEHDFNLAELASGFNKKTKISIIHAARLVSIIANNGIDKKPHLIKSVENMSRGDESWAPSYRLEKVMSYESAKDMQEMMELTVRRGTARSSFYRFMKRYGSIYQVGGKTGTIDGEEPKGKRDWFSSYIKTKDHKGFSVAVMINNQKYWYIKSTYLARLIHRYLIKNYFTQDKKL